MFKSLEIWAEKIGLPIKGGRFHLNLTGRFAGV